MAKMIFLSIIAFIVIFSSLILIHEAGHYFSAVKLGVKVEEFGLGLGKKLWGKKIGETEFTFNIIPFGGFVRMLGEETGSKDPRSFSNAPLLSRIIITLAGVFMNFILAIMLLTTLFVVGTNPIIVSKADMHLAYEKGHIQFQDESGNVVSREVLQSSDEEKLIKLVYVEKIQKPLPQAFVFSIQETLRISKAILQKAAEIPVDLIQKYRLPEGLAGPVGIAEITHKIVPQGFLELLRLMALLSISLAVMNLLPIPALDGGRFLFQIFELCLKPFKIKINEKLENYMHIAGYVLLMGLLILITFNDIQRIFS